MLAFNIQFSVVGPALCRVVFVALAFVSWGHPYAAGADEYNAISRLRMGSGASVVMTEDRQKVAGAAGSMDIRVSAPIDERDTPRCAEKVQAFCRDLAASEFQITSLRFMLPEVRGLSPKSLNIRRNSVSASYTFR